MRLKCSEITLKEARPCRLCGRDVLDGYRLKGPVKGYACCDCYREFYGPVAEKTAFHVSDILTRSFWRPFHIEDEVVMLPWLTASGMYSFNFILRRVLPIVLVIALLASDFGLPMIRRVPGNFLELFENTGLFLKDAGLQLLSAAEKLPPVFIRLGGGLMRAVLDLPQLFEQITAILNR